MPDKPKMKLDDVSTEWLEDLKEKKTPVGEKAKEKLKKPKTKTGSMQQNKQLEQLEKEGLF